VRLGSAWCLAGASLFLSPALAAAQDCRLALVLALDVSSSMSGQDDRLQRQGLAHALTSPEVVGAFLSADPVALYVFQWSGPNSQVPILPGWVLVEDEADLVAIAATIAGSERVHGEQSTATGSALLHAANALSSGPPCRRHTVDVSTDGISNQGPDPRGIVRESGLYNGVTVNGLLIGVVPDFHSGDNTELVGWFQHAVLHGPGAFYVMAYTFEDYERAMMEKLLRELEPPVVSGVPADLTAG